MNYIVLEGFSLYMFLTLILLLVIISIISIICAIAADKRLFTLGELIKRESEKNHQLFKANFILKLKHGELDTDD